MFRQQITETASKTRNLAPNFGGKRLLSIMIAASLPGMASAEIAGTVNFASGSATVVHANGSREPLASGMTLAEKDSIQTGRNGLAQVRFTDGAYVSIQKNTVFIIDEYSYDGQPNRKGSDKDNKNTGLFSLLSGSFRAITGFLGTDNYQVKTPVATIGIRGTEYFTEFGRSLAFNVADGAIEVCNTAGCQFFRENEFGDVAGTSSAIKRLQDLGLDVVVSEVKDQTAATVEGDDDFAFNISEEVTEDGGLQIIEDAALPDCSNDNCTLAFGWVNDVDNTKGLWAINSVTAYFDQNAMAAYQSMGGQSDHVGSGIPTSAGATPLLAWGRWSGGASNAGKTELHYVVGTPTPNINSLTGSTELQVSGWTEPSVSDSSALGAFNGAHGQLSADFDRSEVDLNFTSDFANADYHVVTGSPIFINTDATFNGTTTVMGGIPDASGMPGMLSCDTSTCTADVKGFFAGANASSAGLSYHVLDTAVGDIVGAVVFQESIDGTTIEIPNN